MRRAISTALVAIAATGATVGVIATNASAMGAPIQITQDVNMRSGPGTSFPRVGGIYAGQSPDFICWAVGENISGVNVWFDVNANGATGYYASYYDNSSYATDALITSKYGIPQCGTQPTPAPPVNPQPPAVNPQPPTVNPQGPTVNPQGPTVNPQGGGAPSAITVGGNAPASSGVTAAESTAINWARPYADRHSRTYNDLCLTFVFKAYAAAGTNLRNWVNVPIGYNTYPADIWGHFTHGRTGGGTPPAGALVFWNSRYGRTYSHVALSLGGGNLVSTSDGVANNTHYETMSQHRYAIYLGWWLPDR